MVREKIPLQNAKGFSEIAFFKGKGCDRCSNTGYKGRIGIYELIEMDDDIQILISERKDADTIAKKALEKEYLTMLQDGLIKAAQGLTTIEEVLRVTQE
ncbi:MAG: hypothetical protein FJZ04_02445 [Candidatus Moranbacteria bacterium]|nr:hypothetical protein [Candidatus Moranbacteria bacterium]